jgi:replicative DNA helicase
MSSNFNLGLSLIHRMCQEQSPLEWHRAKLSDALFQGQEKKVHEWVHKHVQAYHALPQLETLYAAWPDTKEVQTPEPVKYYLTKVENKYFHGLINTANLESQAILKHNQDDFALAQLVMQGALDTITAQKYRTKIVDAGLEGVKMVATEYGSPIPTENVSEFGWEYLDAAGPVLPGDVVSIVGRPASGKSFMMLYTAIYNWKAGRNTLFVSMEMSPLPIMQRVAAMYAHTNITQLKSGGYSNVGPGQGEYGKFKAGLMGMTKEGAKLYVVDGNLAADVEDVYTLAQQLKCKVVIIDGAYLLRHKNPKLDRFNRVAENCEMLKRYTGELLLGTYASWQFNRDANKVNKAKGETATLDHIAYSDAIGQISAVILAMLQEDGVETLKERIIQLLKGRNGETGQFSILWDFLGMNFNQVVELPEQKKVMKWV